MHGEEEFRMDRLQCPQLNKYGVIKSSELHVDFRGNYLQKNGALNAFNTSFELSGGCKYRGRSKEHYRDAA